MSSFHYFDSLPAGSVSQDAAQLNPPAELSSSPVQQQQPDNPLMNAFVVRTVQRGLAGTLFATNSNIEGMLAKSGPVGQDLLERLDLMKQRGWTYGAQLPIGDPYLTASTPNPITRFGRYLAIGGSNVSEYNGAPFRRISYNNFSHLLGNAFMSHGNASPLTRVTSTVAHELGHYDGIPLSYQNFATELDLPQQRILATRLLETETNAVLTQLHIADANKAFHPDLETFRPGLRDGTFGARLRANWTSPGAPPLYQTLKLLTPEDANRVVQSHIARNYGGIIDVNGKVGAFDLAGVYGKYTGELPRDAAILANMAKYSEGVKPPAVPFFSHMSGTTTGRMLGRGLQAAGVLGIAYSVTEVGNAFNESPGSGVGKIGRIGLQFGGAEVGSIFGAKLGMKLALTSIARGKLGLLVVPLSTIFGSMVGVTSADLIAGDTVEQSLKTMLDGR